MANQHQPIPRTVQIGISKEKLAQLGPDNPVVWYAETPQQPLRLAKELAETQAVPDVTLGVDTLPDVQVAIRCDRRPLNEASEFVLTVRAPDQLTPGVYQGEIAFRIETLDPPAGFRYVRPLRLFVHGRHIAAVQFSRVAVGAAQPEMPVGSPASVKVILWTVGEGFAMGEGQLELWWKRDPNAPVAAEPLLRVPLPLPQEPQDLLLDVADDRSCKKTVFCAEPRCKSKSWQAEMIRGAPPQVRQLDADKAMPVTAYEVETHMPDVVAPGQLQAVVTWQRGERPDPQSVIRAASPEVRVTAGIVVQHRQIIRDEPVRIMVVGTEEFKEPVTLEIGPEGQPPPSKITARPPEQQRHDDFFGSLYTCEATYTPSEFGPHLVRWVGSSANDAGKETSFFVGLGASARLSDPLIPFAGDPPPLFSPEGSGRFRAVRKQALQVWGDDRLLLDYAAIRAVYRVESATEFRRLRADNLSDEPDLKFTVANVAPPATEKTDAEPGDVSPAAPAAPPTDSPADGRWRFQSNRLGYDFETRLDEASQDPPRQRNELGRRNYVLRLNIVGSGVNGMQVCRVVDIPFAVEVTNMRVYCWPFIQTLLLIVAVLCVVGVVWYRFHRWAGKPRGDKKSGSGDGELTPLSPESGVGPPVGVRPVAASAASVAAPTPTTQVSGSSVASLGSFPGLAPPSPESSASSLGPPPGLGPGQSSSLGPPPDLDSGQSSSLGPP